MSSISKQLSAINCASRNLSSPANEIRLVLLGKTGSGKSSTANTILGRNVFDTMAGSSSVTKCCHRACGEFCGRHLIILDTPGFMDTQQTTDDVQRELRRSVSLLYPGPHVFLLVIQIGRFTREEKEAIRQFKQALGSHALSFSVVVFTHGDLLGEGESIQHCMIDDCSDLGRLVDGCGGRYCVFNNHTYKNKEQVSELFVIVDSLLQVNKGSYYDSKMMQKAEEDLARVLQEGRRLTDGNQEWLKKELETTVKEAYEKELEMIQQKSKKELEELMKKHKLEIEREEKEARKWEEAYRQGVDEKYQKEKERELQELTKVMEVRREERERRQALQERLEQVTKMLEEQTGREEKMKRAVEAKIHKDHVENEKRERERELQQLQKEQAIKQKEEMKRDALQKELDKVTQSLEDQRRKEENMRRQMEHLLRREREENQRERDIQMENQKVVSKRIVALQEELKLIRMKIQQQKMSEENLRRLKDNVKQKRDRGDKEMLKELCDSKRTELCNKTSKKSDEMQSVVNSVTGYVQEMGQVALNAALETIRIPF